MRILFWGTPDFAVPSLRALDDEGFAIVAVVTQPDRPAGRGRRMQPSVVKRVALELGFPVLEPEDPRAPELMERIRALEPDVSVVVTMCAAGNRDNPVSGHARHGVVLDATVPSLRQLTKPIPSEVVADHTAG